MLPTSVSVRQSRLASFLVVSGRMSPVLIGGSTVATQEIAVTTTVWQALEAWANTLMPWQRRIISLALDHSKLNEEEVTSVYADLLTPPAETLLTIPESASATEPVTVPLRLDRIDKLTGINALPDGASLTFGPGLTVVFGRNGVGKTGFARVLANACFSRSKTDILPNIHVPGTPAACSAQFHISLNDTAAAPIPFPQSEEIAVLQRITFFDSFVAKQHVSQATSFEFRPRGFDIFTEMARVYAVLTRRLDADIATRSLTPDFMASFIGSTTEVSKAVSALSATTDIAALRQLASYGNAERARLTQLDDQLTSLKAKSPKAALVALDEARADIQTLRARVQAVGAEFTQDAARTRTELAVAATEAAKNATLLGSDTFKRPFFNAVGSPDWEAFVKAAHALGTNEATDYPNLKHHCLLCERALDAGAQNHIAAIFAFVEGDAQQLAASTQRSLDTVLDHVRALSLPNFSAETRVRAHIHRLDPETETTVAETCEAIGSAREQTVLALRARQGEMPSVDSAECIARLSGLIERIDADITRLSADDVEASIAALDLERETIRHREVLSQLLPQIELRVENLKWLNNANLRKGGLNTRHITDKEKELFERIVTTSYKEHFARECELLDCRVPIELQTIGRSGQTMRTLSVPGGHKPDTILSEGEQRAVALSDFLTEVALNPAAAGIILDDPVTSQDFERKQRIADRLAAEAKRRQVIVITHDLVFLNQLLVAAEKSAIDTLTHWIQRDGEGRPGDVALGDCPDTDKTYKTTQKAKDALARAQTVTGRARAAAIIAGMGALRTTLEVSVANRVLKETVRRWNEQIRVTALRNINWDNAKVEEICALYEELSRFIDAHSHSDEATGAPPEIRDLEEKIVAVDALIGWARANRS